jgi:hypothetical protein
MNIEATKGGSQVFGVLVSAALQAINASMSIGSSYSVGEGTHVSYNYSNSTESEASTKESAP